MRILFTRFPLESRHGGAEVQTISLMKGLMGRGHAPAFLGSCPTLLALCRESDLLSAELDIGPPPVTKWHAVSFAWRRKKMQRTLESAIREFGRLDAVCMLSLSEKLLLTPFALERRMRVLWIEHDRVGRWLTKNPWLPRLREFSKRVTTVTVSELSAKIYRNLGWENVVAIPNGIDEKRLEGSGQKGENYPLPAIRSQLSVGTLARLSPDKGVDVLIAAAEELPDIDLTVVGTGSEEGFLRNWMGSVNQREALPHPRFHLAENVESLGDFYRNLDVFVLPSRQHDPFGLVAAEAMLCGTATIVTDACGIAGYLKADDDALIVPADDRGALVDALKRMQDPLLRDRIAKHGQKTAKEKFSIGRMVDAYERLLAKS